MEMNLHMPQDIESEAELINLAAIPHQIISPGNNAPIIGIFQDSMLGSYLFTRANVLFDKKTSMNLLMMVDSVNPDIFKSSEDLITNFDILSQIMPPFTMKVKNKQFGDTPESKKNNMIEIKNGKYIGGQIDKGVLGSGSKGILHRICNDFGNMACSDFIDNLQSVITDYITKIGYSVGVSDLISDKITSDSIISVISIKKNEVKDIIDQTQLGIFDNKSGKTNEEEFEIRVNNILNQASAEAGKIGLKSLSKDNRFVIMVNAGSKGSDLNISQMISCLGQQNIDGKRIPYGFEHRTLPHYTKYDDSPSARGFVESSFINGLSPQELFFHAMGGRIGLIDTAVKSVSWDTKIIIIENEEVKYIEIGKWIDNQLDTLPENVQRFTERNLELMNLKNDTVYIPTTDYDGNVSWGEVSAITRHDPGTQLYEIKTSGGRSVIVTESKSLLIWNSETKKFKEMLTPDIKVGDCVPVTAELCSPPIIIDKVDMSKYFPKNEYVYGSDFNKAIVMMNDAMNNKNKINSGWWYENNGKNFTLPYTKKSSLQRTFVRSSLENIKDGFIYPYHSARKDTLLKDTFDLTEENGIFIGLFLAEGNVYKNTITITNNNINITSFVKKWFDTHSINWNENVRINKIGGKTTTIRGNSSILSTFLTKFVGSGAENKYVPNEAFISPECFIIGILNGYFSGDGTVGKNSVEVGSASYRLIEGINMLLSRLGIFGKVFKTQLKSNNLGTKNIKPTHRLSIRSQWGRIFSNKIPLLEETKQNKLININWNTCHRGFETFSNVVLDKIEEINIIGVENHPKMYDLTIPSTLNFGLANGLQVRDTSTTGYIQRRLVKALEDLMVRYDGTVRSSKDYIVQFLFGEDGIDTVKVENQDLNLLSMSIAEIYSHYNLPEEDISSKVVKSIFTKSTFTNIKKEKEEYNIIAKKYTDMMLVYRNDIMKYVFNNKNDRTIRSPVAFGFIINNIIGQQNINSNSLVDLTFMDAYNLINQNYEKLNKLYYNAPTELFKMLYYFHLSPKDLLLNKRFNRIALIVLLETINLTYKRSIVAPGEMVGIIAAQSIGEPTTQLTLNSITYETEIIVRNSSGIIEKVQIGLFTENNIKTSPKIDYMKDKDTTYAELKDYYEVPSCDENGMVSWKKIEAVTRHPVINEDGTNTMLRVITEENREINATKAKSFLKLVDGKIQGVNGKDLKVGDYLPVSKKQLDFTPNTTLDLKKVLPPSEYIYWSEVKKAMDVMGEKGWFKNNGINFTVPYTRADSFKTRVGANKKREGRLNADFKEDCVCMKNNGNNVATIPEVIPLDYNFGYLVGAYCAEGCMTLHQISIANNDDKYFEPILELCEKWNITTKKYKKENCQGNEGWTSQDLRIYNTILCDILNKLCGKLSHNKFVSDKIVFSNKECMLGFLDAYIGGDGFICKKRSNISVSSVSKNMLIDVQNIFNNLDIYSYIKKYKKQETNNIGSKNIKQIYT